MKLYSTIESERASKGQGGNDYITIKLQRERDRLEYFIHYTEQGIRVTMMTDDGGAIVYEASKGEKQKGEMFDICEKCGGQRDCEARICSKCHP